MNNRIVEHYQNRISTLLDYFSRNSIRSSIEDYKESFFKTADLESEEWREHNLAHIEEFYESCISALSESEEEMDEPIHKLIDHFKKADQSKMANQIKGQIMKSLEGFSLKPQYKGFNGLFFIYSDGPYFSGIGFKEEEFPIILDEAGKIEFKDGDYVCDRDIPFNLEEFLSPIYDEEYEDVVWAFEGELDIFSKMKELYYSQVAVSLNIALFDPDLTNALSARGFEKNGVVYLEEQDAHAKMVFVNQ